MDMKHVEGDKKKKITLYTLSTCIWCKMTKAFLQKLGVGYDYVDVDLLKTEDKDKAMTELKQFNPQCSFPSLIIDGTTCIVGYDEQKITDALKP